jgi:hypothetical protein
LDCQNIGCQPETAFSPLVGIMKWAMVWSWFRGCCANGLCSCLWLSLWSCHRSTSWNTEGNLQVLLNVSSPVYRVRNKIVYIGFSFRPKVPLVLFLGHCVIYIFPLIFYICVFTISQFLIHSTTCSVYISIFSKSATVTFWWTLCSIT